MASDDRDTGKIDNQAERLRKMRLNMEFGDEMAEIVRRLANCYHNSSDPLLIMKMAARLWAKMRKESEGRDGK